MSRVLPDLGYDIIYRNLDPYQLYVDRAAINAAQATGFERLVYKIFGKDVIASFAFAIDPLHSFKKTLGPSHQVLRRRVRNRPSFPRSYAYERTGITENTYYIPGSWPYKYTEYIGNWYTVYSGGAQMASQDYIQEFTVDTVNSSRQKGSNGGPFEKFEFELHSLPIHRDVEVAYSENVYNPGPATRSRTRDKLYSIGPAAVLALDDQELLLQIEQNLAQESFEKYHLPMLARCLPKSPKFGSFRSIGELRDFRHVFAKNNIRDLDDLINHPENLRRKVLELRDVPNTFLYGSFAIQPLISDIQALLKLPAQVATQFNKLRSRSGLPTSYRTKFKLDLPFSDPPSFSFLKDGLGYDDKYSTTGSRDAEVRMAVNATFEFPPIETPLFNAELYARLTGIEPSIKALYDLTPWTWLTDWFTGFGNYLNVIEQINTDPSLINYGYITYASKCSVLSQYSYKTGSYEDRWYHPSPSVHADKVYDFYQYGKIDYTYQKRIDLSELGVRTTGKRESLTPFQTLIISALLAQRI